MRLALEVLRPTIAFALTTLLSFGVARAAEPAADRFEPGVLPAVAHDADVGFKFGVFTQLARFRDELRPYAWRAQMLAAMSVREGSTGTEFPYREVYFRLDRPRFLVERLRLLVHVGYLRTTNLGYYGVGNATPATPRWRDYPSGSDDYVVARRFYQFDGTAPSARVTARYRLHPNWQVMSDVYAQWVGITVYHGSLLDQDRTVGPGFSLGRGLNLRGTVGVVRDTRNHETVPTDGTYHEGSLRCGGGLDGDSTFCALNLTLRGYWGILGERLIVAGRALADVAFGSPPLLELSRYGGVEGGTGPGGARGIRGVPQGRLAGKSKVIGNFEVRSFLLPFALGSQRFCLGVAGFADIGRVWANALSTSEQDGSFRMHWGAGAGPRLRWGDSLLIRADVSYAPLGADLGAAPAIYVDVEQVM